MTDKVMKIYHDLYKFSLERLQKLINEPLMMMVAIKYAFMTGMIRIHEKSNLVRFKDAYYEALIKLIDDSDNRYLLYCFILK